jgi:glycosyltransferase involved in cell wall biosynthesis
MPDLYFYAPKELDRKFVREDYTRWTGYHSNFTAWVAQTYFYLKKAGFSCKIADKIPEEGILIADRDSLDNNYPCLDRVMLICAKSDREYHPSAHLHVVHNPPSWQKDRDTFWNPHLISHWLMPGLIPRDKERQNLVENIAYIGTSGQLAPELKSKTWTETISSLNCNWMPICDTEQWNDYSCLDVVVAARSFNSKVYPNKGAIKLINAWYAGVPAILTPESGFLAERRTELDFLLVHSLEEAIQAVDRLKRSPELYHQMVYNGYERSQEYTIQQTSNKWISFIKNIVFPTYEKWSKLSRYDKKMLFLRRYFAFKYDRSKRRLEKINDRYN